MSYKDIMFPVSILPGGSLIGPLQDLAYAMHEKGGSLKEVWVSRELYDGLTEEITNFERYMGGEKREHTWQNGLIIINTPFGPVKIRRAD